MKWVLRSLRFLLVTAGIVVLTSMGIDASQFLSGSQSALGILVDRATTGDCPKGMTRVAAASGSFCIDIYEVGVGEACPHKVPNTSSETSENIADPLCQPTSQKKVSPWVNASFHQAKEICGKAGKRLPTQAEWYAAGLGTPAASCAINTASPMSTGSEDSCVSGAGAYDMVGNVWEWVEGEIADGQYAGRTVPPEGFVQNADADGVALETGTAPNDTFGKDYFWSDNVGTYATMRGGYYSSKEDAGLYTIHAKVSGAFSGNAIGFRCVQ